MVFLFQKGEKIVDKSSIINRQLLLQVSNKNPKFEKVFSFCHWFVVCMCMVEYYGCVCVWFIWSSVFSIVLLNNLLIEY